MRTIAEFIGPDGFFVVTCNIDGSGPFVVRDADGKEVASSDDEHAVRDSCMKSSGFVPAVESVQKELEFKIALTDGSLVDAIATAETFEAGLKQITVDYPEFVSVYTKCL